MTTTYYGTYSVPSFGGTGKTSGYTTLATTGCFSLVLTQATGGTAGQLRLRNGASEHAVRDGADTPPNCKAPVVGDGVYTNIDMGGTVAGSTYTEDPAALDPFGDLANVWDVYDWFHTSTTIAHVGSVSDNASGYGVPNDTDGVVNFYDHGPITGMTITGLTPTSGRGTFKLGTSEDGGTGGNVSGTITVLGSTQSSVRRR